MITKFRRDKIQKETEIIQAAFCVWYLSSGALKKFCDGRREDKVFCKAHKPNIEQCKEDMDGAVVTLKANAFQHCGLN